MIFKIIVAIIFILLSIKTVKEKINDYNIKQAGNEGEAIARKELKQILNKDDHLINNFEVDYQGQRAEFDNIIVNNDGVFIIEVKNYVGELTGDEDDDTWHKEKTTDAGNTYEKEVKNPIKQVKREIYILSKYLSAKGSDAWVEGYVYMINGNSPFKSEYLYDDIDGLDSVIHINNKDVLSDTEVNKILSILK